MNSKSLLSCAFALILLQGCGGGGGGGGTPSSSNSGAPSGPTTPPAAPAPNIKFALKQLQFNWTAVGGATSYRVLEDADGSGTFKQVSGDLTAVTYSRDIAVHTFNWSKAQYQVQACNSVGCSTSGALIAADGVLKTIGYFKPSTTNSGDTFGWSIALSDNGTTLAVGVPLEDGGGVDSGAVYVFTNSGSGWMQQTSLKAATATTGANFGESVALSSDGKILAVGAPFEDGGAGGTYIFTRSDTAPWGQQSRIKASNAYANAYFGWTVALNDSGATLAIGAPGEPNSGSSVSTNTHSASNAGAAYVFTLDSSGAASNQIYLKASTIAADDNFGAAIALSGSGTVLAVGSPYKSNGVGAAYVFTYNSNTWGSPTYLNVSDSGASNFGAALTLDTAGNTLAIGAPYEAANAGAAYVFTRSSNTSAWGSQPLRIQASNTDANDDFGSALALSGDGNSLAIGAIGESSKAVGVSGNADTDNSKDGVGAVYLFKRSDAAWSQRTYVKPSVSTSGDEFGTAISLSADGGTLAISGAFEQSKATGIATGTDTTTTGGAQDDITAADAGAVWLF